MDTSRLGQSRVLLMRQMDRAIGVYVKAEPNQSDSWRDKKVWDALQHLAHEVEKSGRAPTWRQSTTMPSTASGRQPYWQPQSNLRLGRGLGNHNTHAWRWLMMNRMGRKQDMSGFLSSEVNPILLDFSALATLDEATGELCCPNCGSWTNLEDLSAGDLWGGDPEAHCSLCRGDA